jgi:hypothetical protein
MPNAGTARCAPTFQNNELEKTFGNRYTFSTFALPRGPENAFWACHC